MDIIIVKGEVLNWDEFQEWHKKQYGWYIGTELATGLRLYLKEKEKDKEDSGEPLPSG